MNTLEEVIQKVTGLSHDEKVVLGRNCLTNINEALIYVGIDEETRLSFILAVIGVAISSDRSAAFEEYALFCSIFGEIVKYETFYDLTNGGASEEVVAKIDSLVDSLPTPIKYDCCTLALLFMGADGEVDEKEKAVFERLLA